MSNSDIKGTRVLIVDDSATMRSLLRNLLVTQDYEVVGQLASGAGLLDAIVKIQPDIVCLDYHLPDSDGMDLLRQVTAAHPEVSVVMITGNTDQGLEETAADAGAAGFISKPFSVAKLAQDMRQIVQARRLLASLRRTPGLLAAHLPHASAVIADDSATMRSLLSSILTSAGIQVVAEAGDGKQAVGLVRQFKPDIVCLDWDMPIMNGLEALRLIRAEHPDIRALMITARSTREAIIQANQAGAKGYILKPFQPDKVTNSIAKLLG